MKIVLALIVAAVLGVFAFSRVDPLGFADRKREVRLALGLPKQWSTGFNVSTAGYAAAACPGAEAIVIVTGGQSNAANALGDALPVDAAARAYMFEAGKCWRLRDPVLGATGAGGSLWTELGSAIYRSTGRPVVFVNGAVGGSQVGDWLDERSHYRVRLVERIAGARAAGLAPDVVLWVQGETDAAVLLPPGEFVREIEDLIEGFDAGGMKGVPWVVYRSTHCLRRRGNGAALDRAVEGLAARSERVVLGPLASRLGDEMRRDGCHFNGRGRAVLTGEVIEVLRGAGVL